MATEPTAEVSHYYNITQVREIKIMRGTNVRSPAYLIKYKIWQCLMFCLLGGGRYLKLGGGAKEFLPGHALTILTAPTNIVTDDTE